MIKMEKEIKSFLICESKDGKTLKVLYADNDLEKAKISFFYHKRVLEKDVLFIINNPSFVNQDDKAQI